MDEHRRDDLSRRLRDLFYLGLERLLEVQSVGGDGRTSGLDLSPEVLGLVDVEPVGVGEVRKNVYPRRSTSFFSPSSSSATNDVSRFSDNGYEIIRGRSVLRLIALLIEGKMASVAKRYTPQCGSLHFQRPLCGGLTPRVQC